MTRFAQAIRSLTSRPLLAAVIVLSLGAGIGANSIVLTWIRGLVTDPIPGLRDPARLAVICSQHKNAGLGDTLSVPDMRALAAETRIFAGVTGSQMGTALLRVGEQKEWLWIEAPLANYFDVLGVRPILGRAFQPGEDAANPPLHAVVISHRLWQRRFTEDPAIAGKTVEINRQPAVIVGVAPADFHGTMGGLSFDAWIVPALHEERDPLMRRAEQPGWRWAHAIGRLAPGVSLEDAQAGTVTVAERLAKELPGTYRDVGFAVLPLWKSPWGAQGFFGPVLFALALGSLLLLILVVANVAHLLLARAYERESEMSVRLALGASPLRIIRMLLHEAMLLAVLGGALGWLLASSGAALLLELMPSTYLPLRLELGADRWILAGTALLTLGAGLAAGLAPALQCARASLVRALKEDSRAVARASQKRLRLAFVTGEVALATALLIAMGLCIRSLDRSRSVPIGLNPKQVFVAGFRIGPQDGDDARVDEFYQRLRHESAALPGVDSAGLADWLPLGFEGGSSTWVTPDGYLAAPGESLDVSVSIVSPGYFEALRIPLRQGRSFDESDTREQPFSVIVNEAYAERFFPGRSPLGLKLRLWGREATILGVAANGKYRFLNEPLRPYLYVNQLQYTDRTLTLVVRGSAPPAHMKSAIEGITARLDPTLAPVAAMPYEQYIAAAWVVPRMAATLLSALGGLALLLAVLGVYAVVSQQVIQRTREFAIRMAVGAQRADVFGAVLRGGLVLALLGLLLGALAGAAVSRTLGALLIGIGPADAVSWGGAALLLLATVLIACAIPARRAARLQPMEALRAE